MSKPMYHDRALTVLVTELTANPDEAKVSPEILKQAEEHVAHCGDCWDELSSLYEAWAKSHAAEAISIPRAPIRCEEANFQLWRLAEGNPLDIARSHPDLVAHVQSCRECVEVLRETRAALAMERAEEWKTQPLTSPAIWQEQITNAGKTVREFISLALVRVRESAATFLSVPEGAYLMPRLATVGARRGATATDLEPINPTAIYPLAESDEIVELRVQSGAKGLARIDIRRVSAAERRLAIRLRRNGNGGSELFGSRSGSEANPAIFQDVPTGSYMIEVEELESGVQYRLKLELTR